MRLKNFTALVLSGAMIIGTVGMMEPLSVKASALTPQHNNTYTLTVPEKMDIKNSGWNELGTIGLSGDVDESKKVTVVAAGTNEFNLVDTTNAENKIHYTVKASDEGEEQTSFEFKGDDINAGAEQKIGIYVEKYADKAAGTYEGTINYTATMSNDEEEYGDFVESIKEGKALNIVLETTDSKTISIIAKEPTNHTQDGVIYNNDYKATYSPDEYKYDGAFYSNYKEESGSISIELYFRVQIGNADWGFTLTKNGKINTFKSSYTPNIIKSITVNGEVFSPAN